MFPKIFNIRIGQKSNLSSALFLVIFTWTLSGCGSSSSTATTASSSSGGTSAAAAVFVTSDAFSLGVLGTSMLTTDATLGGTSKAWVATEGVVGRSGTAAVPISLDAGLNDGAITMVDAGYANCTYTLKIVSHSGGTGLVVMFVRIASGAAMNGDKILVIADTNNQYGSGNVYVVERTVGGVGTDFISAEPTAPNDQIRVVTSGANTTITVNGNSIYNASDASLQSNTFFGFGFLGDVSGSVDDFIIKDCT